MFRFFVDESQVNGKELVISGGDVNHIKNVLRMKPLDEVEAVLPDGRIATCSLRELTDDEIIADVLFVEESGVELGNKITLYMGLPKFDKMELVIQKAVELGAYRIVPVSMKRTVVKFDPKKPQESEGQSGKVAGDCGGCIQTEQEGNHTGSRSGGLFQGCAQGSPES